MTKIHSHFALVLLVFLLGGRLFGEENNPCLHEEWGDVQYQCTTWVSGASVVVACNVTPAEAVAKIKSASGTNGRCLKYRFCRSCGEQDNLGENSFSDISCGQLSCKTDPGGHVEGSGSCEVYAVCHEKRSSTGTVQDTVKLLRRTPNASAALAGTVSIFPTPGNIMSSSQNGTFHIRPHCCRRG